MADITITINAKDGATPTVQQVKASFEGLGEEIAKSMEKATAAAERSSGGIGSFFLGAAKTVLGAFLAIPNAIAGIFSTIASVAGSILSGLVSLVEGVVSGIIKAFKILPEALGLIFNKVTAIATAAFSFVVFKLGEAAAAAEGFGEELELLAKRAGTSASAIVKAIQEGSGRTVDRLNAMRIANQALIQGVIKTPEQFRILAALADKLNDVLGVDTAEAFQQLILGIEAGNERLLKGIGIFADAGKAAEDYAMGLGKHASDLTQAEKAQAFLNVVLEQGAKIIADTSTKTDLLGDKFARLKVALKEAFLDAAAAVGPALGAIVDALEPIVKATSEWISKNRELVASKLSEFAERLAGGIGKVAEKMPEIVHAIGSGLGAAFSFAARAADLLWTGITDAIAGAQREFEVFRTAVVGLLNGEGFDVSGSALIAGFRVIKAQVKVLALEAAAAFTESFGQTAADIANKVREFQNSLLSAKEFLVALQLSGGNLLASFVPGKGFGHKEFEKSQAESRAELERLVISERHAPVTPASLSRDLSKAKAAAEDELDLALEQLGPILEDIDKRGQAIRDKASEKVEGLKTSLSNFFEADTKGRERELEAHEEANDATLKAIKTTQDVVEVVVQEEKKKKKTAEELKARADELLRQMQQMATYYGQPLVTVGN